MDNKFNINSYFTAWYGLGKAPTVNKIKIGKIIIGVLLVFIMLLLTFVAHWIFLFGALLFGFLFIGLPILKVVKEKKAYNAWNDNYEYRRTNWYKEYDKFLEKTINDLNLKQRGLNKIGIDESQIDDISEGKEEASGVRSFSVRGISLQGYYRQAVNNTYRTQYYEVTWIYFTKEQILTYNIKFDLLDLNRKTESTEEFFYDDIVSVSTSSESVDVKAEQRVDETKKTDSTVVRETFRIVVPGDKLTYSFTPTEEAVKSVKGLTGLIRSKKSANK